jgi:hypothetical protein
LTSYCRLVDPILGKDQMGHLPSPSRLTRRLLAGRCVGPHMNARAGAVLPHRSGIVVFAVPQFDDDGAFYMPCLCGIRCGRLEFICGPDLYDASAADGGADVRRHFR